MNENENLVTEEVTENVESQTTEEIVEENVEEITNSSEETSKGKFYTDEELDSMLNDRYKRGIKRGEKETKRKYGKIENILKQGLEADNLEDIETKLSDFYKENGVNLKNNTDYDEEDMNILAFHDADEIIENGYSSVESELQRLADKGVKNMTKREKIMFERLHSIHQLEKGKKELASIGVKEDVLESKEFKEYEKKLNPNLSYKEKYEMFEKTLPKPEVETIGSMKNDNKSDSGVKEFYTYDEAIKFSREDLYKNPKLEEAINNSMSKW